MSDVRPPGELRDALLADERIAAAVLFGSAARDQLRPDSDVDVAVLPRDGAADEALRRDPLATLGTLGLAAGRDVHLILLPRVDEALRRTVLRTGRVLFDRSGGALDALWARTLIEAFDGEYLRRTVSERQREQLAPFRRTGHG